MNLACQITVARMLLVPVFVALAAKYGLSTAAGHPEEWLRWSAVGVFVLAAGSDGIDGWVARRFNQKTQLGAFLDPFADKLLMGFGVLMCALVDWGREGWHLPMWFAVVVWLRDAIMIVGIVIITRQRKLKIHYSPHWSGKATTVLQMATLGWVMLGWIDISPVWPCVVAAVMTAWSGVHYVQQGMGILRQAEA